MCICGVVNVVIGVVVVVAAAGSGGGVGVDVVSRHDCHGLPGDNLPEFEDDEDELELCEIGPRL